MDTITKSTKKSLLAATVVALLALVAIAGAVTYSADDSSAATTNYNYLAGSVTVSSDTAATNFFIYGGDSTVTIPADVTYTGTVSFGYYDAVSGLAVAYTTVTFTGLSNASVAYDSTDSSVTVSTNATDAKVDMTVTAGAVSIGDNTVSGTVTAASATFTLTKATYLSFSVLNGKGYVSTISSETTAGTLEIAGEAYTYGLTTADAAAITVDKDATLTTAAMVTGQEYSITITTDVKNTGAFNETASTVETIDGSPVAATTPVFTIDANGIVTVSPLVKGEYLVNLVFDAVAAAEKVAAVSTYTVQYVVVVTADGSYYVAAQQTVSANATATYTAASTTASTPDIYTITLTVGNVKAETIAVEKIAENTAVAPFTAATTLSTLTASHYYLSVDKDVMKISFLATDIAKDGTSFVISFGDGTSIFAVEKLVVKSVYTTDTTTSKNTYSDGSVAMTAFDAATPIMTAAQGTLVGTVTFTIARSTVAASGAAGVTVCALYSYVDGKKTPGAPAKSSSTLTIYDSAKFEGVLPGSYVLVMNIDGAYNIAKVVVSISGTSATAVVSDYSVTSTSSSADSTAVVTVRGLDFIGDGSVFSAKLSTGAVTYANSVITVTGVTPSATDSLGITVDGTEFFSVKVATNTTVAQTVKCNNGISTSSVTATYVATGVTGAAAVIANSGAKATITVLGTLAVTYDGNISGDVKYNSITNSGTIDVSAGLMTIASSVTSSCDKLTNTGIINAAYYVDTSATAAPYTFYYTDLATALTSAAALKSNVTVTVIGTLTLSENLTVPTGTSTTKMITLVIDTGATLNVGTADKEVTMTVPDTTSTTAANALTTAGQIVIVNGQLDIAKLTSDAYAKATSASKVGINAAVFYKTDAAGIYTDLTIALAAATSGQTVTLRGDAIVTKDTTVATGVTLDLNSFAVAVGDNTLKSASTPTFTINGTVKNAATAKDACYIVVFTGATVAVNSSDATDSNYLGYLVLGGTLTVGDGSATVALGTVGVEVGFGTLNVAKNATITSNVSLFRVPAGILASTATYTAQPITLNVAGEMSLTDVVSGSTTAPVTITKDQTLNVDVKGTLNMQGTYTNAGAVTITVEKDAKLVPTAAISLTNNGKLTLSVAGTLAYDKDKAVTITNTAGTVCDLTVAGTLGLKAITDAAKTASVTVTGAFTVADVSSVNTMTVSAGSFAASSTFDVAKTLAVSGTATFTAAGTTASTGVIAEATVSDSASLTESAAATITKLTVSGTATVKGVAPATAGTGASTAAVISVTALSVGTASKTLAASTNGATVTVKLVAPTSGTAYGIVYGDAANVKITGDNLVQTNLYLVGTDDNILYAVEYSLTASVSKLVLETLDVTGYKMNGWFDSAVGTNTVVGKNVGDLANIYATFTAKTYTVTFTYVEGAIYLVNGAQVQSGPQDYAYGTHLTIGVIAASGYDASKATVDHSTLDVKEPTTVTATGITEKTASKDNGLSLTDILLIILVIITAIVAIAVVLKLARS